MLGVLVVLVEEEGEDQRRVVAVACEKEGRAATVVRPLRACSWKATAAAAADGRDAAAVAAAAAAGWKGAEAKEAGASGVLRWWGRTGTKAWLALKRNRKQQQEARKKRAMRLENVSVVVMTLW